MIRLHRFVDCHPAWGVEGEGDARSWVTFACPEGHDGCVYIIPFTPRLDGVELRDPNAGGRWERTGETFDTLTLMPSIRGVPEYDSLGAAIVAGLAPERIHPRAHCHAHFSVRDGAIEFREDSR